MSSLILYQDDLKYFFFIHNLTSRRIIIPEYGKFNEQSIEFEGTEKLVCYVTVE